MIFPKKMIFASSILGSLVVAGVMAGILRVAASPPQPNLVDTAPYHVDGRRIVDDNGNQYVPYGVHVPALFEPNWKNSSEYQHFNFEEVQAAHNIWHSNVIDYQVVASNLFPDPNNPDTPDQDYLAAMDTAVSWTNQENMNAILNLQTETTTHEILPTQTSVHFWQFVAAHYKNNPHVFFDLFNEPRDSKDWKMDLWQSGGIDDGVQYVGMQQLVDTVRETGAQNLVFVQGEGGAESLSQLPTHLLSGENIIYAVHPYFSKLQHGSPSDWDNWWGIAAKTVDAPITVTEWNQYQSPDSGCMSNGPELVPTFLNYIKQLNIGLIAWALEPGSLLRGDGNPNDAWDWSKPTAFDQPTYTCRSHYRYLTPNSTAQGAGQLIMNFFAQNSGV